MSIAFYIIAAYIVFAIINFGLLFTYFQRSKLLESKRKLDEHKSMALMVAFFSFAVTPMVLFMTDFGHYGIKFWPGERKGYWHTKYKLLKEEYDLRHPSDAQDYISIWK